MTRRNGILVSRTLYQLGIWTLIAAVIWTASSIYSATSKAEVTTKIDKAIMDPINPTLDESVLAEMVTRLKVEDVPQETPSPQAPEIDIIETIETTETTEIASPSANEDENATIDVGGLR